MEASIIITVNRPKSRNSLVPCCPDLLQPDPLITRSPSASPAPIFRPLSNLPIQPSLLENYDVIAQNKPNFQNAEITVTSYAKKTYPNIPLRSARKNKPNQTQSPRLLTKRDFLFETTNPILYNSINPGRCDEESAGSCRAAITVRKGMIPPSGQPAQQRLILRPRNS